MTVINDNSIHDIEQALVKLDGLIFSSELDNIPDIKSLRTLLFELENSSHELIGTFKIRENTRSN